MKKEPKTIPYEITKPPFFKKGVLRFASSEHYLRVSDRNYRCDLDCRGECGKKEPQIKKENIERNFSRYAVKFGLENNQRNNLFIANLYKSVLHKIIDEEDWGTMVIQGDILDNTIDVIKAEIEISDKIPKEDVKEFQEQFSRLNTIQPKLLLTCMAIGVFKIFSEPENETNMGKTLSMLSKKVYITDTGTINEILLEDWGWYIINYINQNVPNYIAGFEKKGIKIINNHNDKILSLDLDEAVKYFTEDAFKDARHDPFISFFYDTFSITKTLLNPVVKGEPTQELSKGFVEGLKMMNNPAFISASQVLEISGMKLKLKTEKKSEKGKE